jgi:hypothetical protein
LAVVVGVDLPPCNPGLRIGAGKGKGGAGERAREEDADTPDPKEVELGVERRLGLVSPVVEVVPLFPALVLGVRFGVVLVGRELGSTLARILVGGLDGDALNPCESEGEGASPGAGDDEEIAICPVT